MVEDVGVLIANDQRLKSLKYDACGHFNVESIVVQRAIHDDGSPLVLVTADITVFQRDQVYSCRAAYRVDDDGLCTAWLKPPAVSCTYLRGGVVVLRPTARSNGDYLHRGSVRQSSLCSGQHADEEAAPVLLPEPALFLHGIPRPTPNKRRFCNNAACADLSQQLMEKVQQQTVILLRPVMRVKQRLQAGGKSLVRGVRQQYADVFLSATGRAGRSEACCGLLHFSPKVRATVTGLVGGTVDTASPNADTLPPDVPYDALVQHMRGQDLTPDFSTDLPAKAWWQRWWWWEQRWWWQRWWQQWWWWWYCSCYWWWRR